MTSYRTTMREALEEMYQNLNEDNLDLMRKAAGGAKQTLKMKDGKIGVDSFSASAIMQIYDKINDKNKKTFENMMKNGKKADIVKLMKFAMSKVNASYEEFEEEFDLEEGKVVFDDHDADDPDFVKLIKKHGLKAKSDGDDTTVTGSPDKIEKVLQTIYGNDWKDMYTRKGQNFENFAGKEADLDEAPNYSKGSVMVDLENDDPKLMKDIKKMGIKVKDLGDSGNPGYNEYKLTGSPAALKKGGKKFGWDQQTEEVELDEAKMSDIIKFDKRGMSTKDIAKKVGVDESEVKALLSQPKNIQKAIMSLEEFELDENFLPLFFALWGTGAMVVLPALIIYDIVNRESNYKLDAKVGEIVGKLISKFKKDKNYKPNSAEIDASKKLEKEVKSKEPSIFKKAMSKLKSIKLKKEEVELGEEKGPRQLVNPNKEVMIVKKNKVIVIDKKDQDKYMKKGWTLAETLDKEDEPTVKAVVKMLKKASGAHAGQAKDLEKAVTEEDEIDEGKMSQLHQLMKDGKSAKEIAKIMKLDVKTIQALMDEYAGQEIKTEGAAADARRAMRSDPDMKQRAFSKDDSATDDDRKAASKNIMMQMRKSQSLKGRFDVEFQDGKKTKVPTKIAMAVQQKYNSFRKPADKEKFQAQVGKSYKDMLKAVQEGFPQVVTPHPAFASGYKEKGKKKKESTLERMNKKIQENNNG